MKNKKHNPGHLLSLCSTSTLLLLTLLAAADARAVQGPGPTVWLAAQSYAATSSSSTSQPLMDLALSTWVGPGDVLRVKAFPDTGSFVSGNYPILDGGYVVLPMLGLVQVTHFSINSLTLHLTNGYSKILAYPTLQVEPLVRLSMFGGFLRPGMHLVNPLHTLSEALRMAGGPVRDDGLRLLRWERNGTVLATNLTAEVEGTKSLSSLGIKSGDQICITLRTKRDNLPLASFVVSTIVASATLGLTMMVLLK